MISSARGALGAALSNFAIDRRGNTAVFFALGMVPVTLALGASIDYSRIGGGQAQLQQVLDSAVLRMATADTLDSAAGAKNVAGGLASSSISIVSTNFTTSVDALGRNVYIGTATAKLPMSVMAAMGMKNSLLTATAKAASPAAQILTATFKPTKVQGSYSKDIFFWTKDASGAITTKTTVITYRYNGSWGTSTTSPSINSVSATFSIPPYSTFGVGMVAYQDWEHLTGALINPKTYYSDASDASRYMRSSGVCTDHNGMTVYMEDGGDSNFADLNYVMSCTVGKAAGAKASLTN